MAITLKTQGKAPLIENGSYVARIVQIVDFGIQPKEYQGEKKPSQQVLYISFELPTERINVQGEDKPRWVSAQYGVSLTDKSNLTKLLNVVDTNREKLNKGGIDGILNSTLMVQVGTTESGKNNKIIAVSPVPKGLDVAELYGEPSSFSMDSPDPDMWVKFPDWIKDTIRAAEDYNTSPTKDMDASISGS